MKQLSFLDDNHPSSKNSENTNTWKLFVDGASRNNPGPAGAGIYLLKDNHPLVKRGFYLEEKTNNQAEYLALLLGLFYAKKYLSKGDFLHIYSDSELLVKQINGIYAVKDPLLRELYNQVNRYCDSFSYSLKHVGRAENKEADKLANKGIDEKLPLPAYFVSSLKS